MRKNFGGVADGVAACPAGRWTGGKPPILRDSGIIDFTVEPAFSAETAMGHGLESAPMRSLVFATSIMALGACGPSERTGNNDDRPDAAVNPTGDAPIVEPTSRVYAHNNQTLYRLDVATFAPQMIGSMTDLGTESLMDLAIDKSDNMVGVTYDKLYYIDPDTGAVSLAANLEGDVEGLTSLSFVPENIQDNGSADILVTANSQGVVYQIDTTDGTTTVLGDFGNDSNNDSIGSSGDLIGVYGLGIYCTVNVANGDQQDYLARINPANGWKATIVGGGTGFDNIFGLAYWDGKIFGFVSGGADSGKIITIDPATGAGTEVQSGTIRWFGAGVATDAPILQ